MTWKVISAIKLLVVNGRPLIQIQKSINHSDLLLNNKNSKIVYLSIQLTYNLNLFRQHMQNKDASEKQQYFA